jgi:hypothetical protein
MLIAALYLVMGWVGWHLARRPTPPLSSVILGNIAPMFAAGVFIGGYFNHHLHWFWSHWG